MNRSKRIISLTFRPPTAANCPATSHRTIVNDQARLPIFFVSHRGRGRNRFRYRPPLFLFLFTTVMKNNSIPIPIATPIKENRKRMPIFPANVKLYESPQLSWGITIYSLNSNENICKIFFCISHGWIVYSEKLFSE